MRHRNNNAPRHSNGANRPNNQGNNRPRRYNNNNNRSSGSSFDQNDSGNVSRIRRHATAQREKYYNMARDQLTSGDRVQAEYYFQHVEHYTRVLGELPPEQVRQHYSAPQPGFEPNEEQNAQQNAEGNHEHHAEQPAQQAHSSRFSQDDLPPAESALPAFITGGVSRPRGQQSSSPASNSDEE